MNFGPTKTGTAIADNNSDPMKTDTANTDNNGDPTRTNTRIVGNDPETIMSVTMSLETRPHNIRVPTTDQTTSDITTNDTTNGKTNRDLEMIPDALNMKRTDRVDQKEADDTMINAMRIIDVMTDVKRTDAMKNVRQTDHKIRQETSTTTSHVRIDEK